MSHVAGTSTLAGKKIAIHMIKTFPPCHLNADENGVQKSVVFGGVPRTRVGGANIAHTIRNSDIIKAIAPIGTRSRMLPSQVLTELRRMRDEDKAFAEVGEEFLIEAANKLTKIAKKKESDGEDSEKKVRKNALPITSQAIFYTAQDVREIAEIFRTEILNAKDFETFKKTPLPKMNELQENYISIDMALFGRMVTTDFMKDIESAVQIGQAISTHAMNRELDFFSCLDDLIESDEAVGLSGSAMTGTMDFSSPCMYQYAAIDLGLLESNLESVKDGAGKTAEVASAFIKAFVTLSSNTKQSRFASAVPPAAVMVEVLEDNAPPYSYANAFESPVKTFGETPEVTKNSVKALVGYADKMYAALGRPMKSVYFSPEYADEIAPENSETDGNLAHLLKTVETWIKE